MQAKTTTPINDPVQLGAHVRAVRKSQGVSATTAAEAAGMSRMTWHRIERGEVNVAMASWLAAGTALGLRLTWAPDAPDPALPTTEAIRLADYPELRKLAWHVPNVDELTPQEALALYERNWRHVDRQSLSMKEIALINALAITIGGGTPRV